MAAVRITGVKQLSRNLKRLEGKITKEIADACLLQTALYIDARTAPPVTPIDTGNLFGSRGIVGPTEIQSNENTDRSSAALIQAETKTESRRGGRQVRLINTASYALFVHEGTRNQSGQPWLRSTLSNEARRALSIIGDCFRRQIAREGSSLPRSSES